MIRSFVDKETRLIWLGHVSRRLPSDIQGVARRKMRQLDNVERLDELRVPRGNRFEELKGDRKGTYSLRINDQSRICFRWSDGAPSDVRIEDYHR